MRPKTVCVKRTRRIGRRILKLKFSIRIDFLESISTTNRPKKELKKAGF
jgi:hypothetical protein